jgi:citrate lyase subunit beta / citryl-CoA lyase
MPGGFEMAVMRSVLYVPGNSDKMIGKTPAIPADIITLDLEDAVPPAEKERARRLVGERIALAGSGGSQVYVRLNDWETPWTSDDLEAVVVAGLDGVTLAKCREPGDVVRLDWKLQELEARRGLQIGSIKICLLLETAKGVVNAYESCCASPRVVSAIFGVVDFTTDMRVKLTKGGEEQKYARARIAVAARAAGVVPIDSPFVWFRDLEAFEANVLEGIALGYEGKMLDHPMQVEPSNRLYAPSPQELEWCEAVVKVFEEEAIAKGRGAISYKDEMIDTPVYVAAMRVLERHREISSGEQAMQAHG